MDARVHTEGPPFRRKEQVRAGTGVWRSGAALLICSTAAACAGERDERSRPMRGDAERGRAALLALECNVCHEIPGVSGAPGYVGPSLAAYGRKVYVAGKFPNTPEILVQWIMDAPALAPATAMPAFAQVSETQAYDIAAYLHSLR